MQCCGGQKDGVVSFVGKPVRADYLRQAVREFTRDRPHGKNIFHRALPINVEAWLRSLCEFSVATYVPAWWRLRESAKMRHVKRRATFVRIGINNHVPEAETSLMTLAMCLSFWGVDTRRVDDDTCSAVASGALRSDASPVTSFRKTDDFFNLGAQKQSASFVAHLRPTQCVEYEEVVGHLFRGGSVVCVGTHYRLLFGMFMDSSGDVIKRLAGTSLPYYLADHVEKCSDSPLWTMQLGEPSFVSGDPLEGTDCTLKLSEGIQLRTVLALETDKTAVGDSFHTLNAVSECVALMLRRHASDFREGSLGSLGSSRGSLESLSRTSSLARSSSNLVSHLCEAVKRKHLGVVGLVDVTTSVVPVTSPRMGSPKQWEGGNFVETVELVPKKCRNAWVTNDGREIEKTDTTVRTTLRKRRRWPSDFFTCPMCPELHVDERQREQQECRSMFCKSKFVYADTCTHIFFNCSKKRKTEIDKHVHLFTDAALRELERCTDFVF